MLPGAVCPPSVHPLYVATALPGCAVHGKEGGILTAVDPKTGNILKQERLTGALDDYYASRVGAAGMVFLLSQQGKATVVKAGDSGIERSRGTLYCFAVPREVARRSRTNS